MYIFYKNNYFGVNLTSLQVDFFWINRDQRSFEWFVNLLSQLEIEQAELGAAMERFLEMHMYITSALQRSDMKAVGLQLALDLLHEKVTDLLRFLLLVFLFIKNFTVFIDFFIGKKRFDHRAENKN